MNISYTFSDTKEFELLPWNIPENKMSGGDITDIHVRYALY